MSYHFTIIFYTYYMFFNSFINKKYLTKLPIIDLKRRLDNINAVNRVRLPSVEVGAFETVGKVFNINPKKIFIEPFSANMVWSEDNKSIDVYCREKTVSKDIDEAALYDTFNFFSNLCNFEDYKFEPIIDFDFAFNVLPKSTSSGFPLYLKKGSFKNISNVFFEYKKFFSNFDFNYLNKFVMKYPTTIFHRFTPKISNYNIKGWKYKVKYKIRQIFGMSHILTLIEVSLLFNFIERIKFGILNYCTIGLRKTEVSERVHSVRNSARSTNRKIYCGDISGCDMSITQNFHFAFFSPIIEASKGSKYHPHVKSLCSYLTYTPILSKGGVLSRSNGSTTSGSWTTSIFTTFCVFIVCSYSYYMMYNRFPNCNELQVQGDDFIMVIDNEDDAKIIKSLFKDFNLRLKADHLDIVNDFEPIEFLGYYWDLQSAPFQNDSWIISRILFPERRVDISGPDRIIYRYLSIIFQVKNYLSLFKLFFKYDKILNRKMHENREPVFQIVDNTGVFHTAMFPISQFVLYGWTMF